MIDDSDGSVTLLSERTPVARKTHHCSECGRRIVPGEKYEVNNYVFDGELVTNKCCAHCRVVRNWLLGECGGWLYESVEEDFLDHLNGVKHPMSVVRMAVGLKWKWRTPKNDRLLPVPDLP